MTSEKAGEAPVSVLSVKQVMRDLGLSKTAVYDAISRKEIPSIRVGRRILIPRIPYERMVRGEAA
jgi:excisionase family DNA binding protein